MCNNSIINEGKTEEVLNSKNINKQIHDFAYNKVWITKKSRIEAEVRMNKNNDIATRIINWYTFFTLAGSIASLSNKTENGFMTYYTIIVSVGLFGFSNYLNSKNYLEKAFKYRESYLNLSRLETELYNLENSSNTNKLDEFSRLKLKYEDIVALSDNHETIDYQKATKSCQNFKEIFNYSLKIRMLWGVMFILPILIFIIGEIIYGLN